MNPGQPHTRVGTLFVVGGGTWPAPLLSGSITFTRISHRLNPIGGNPGRLGRTSVVLHPEHHIALPLGRCSFDLVHGLEPQSLRPERSGMPLPHTRMDGSSALILVPPAAKGLTLLRPWVKPATPTPRGPMAQPATTGVHPIEMKPMSAMPTARITIPAINIANTIAVVVILNRREVTLPQLHEIRHRLVGTRHKQSCPASCTCNSSYGYRHPCRNNRNSHQYHSSPRRSSTLSQSI